MLYVYVPKDVRSRLQKLYQSNPVAPNDVHDSLQVHLQRMVDQALLALKDEGAFFDVGPLFEEGTPGYGYAELVGVIDQASWGKVMKSLHQVAFENSFDPLLTKPSPREIGQSRKSKELRNKFWQEDPFDEGGYEDGVEDQ